MEGEGGGSGGEGRGFVSVANDAFVGPAMTTTFLAHVTYPFCGIASSLPHLLLLQPEEVLLVRREGLASLELEASPLSLERRALAGHAAGAAGLAHVVHAALHVRALHLRGRAVALRWGKRVGGWRGGGNGKGG